MNLFDWQDMIEQELAQLEQEGKAVGSLIAQYEPMIKAGKASERHYTELCEQAASLPVGSDYPYTEPSSLEEIVAECEGWSGKTEAGPSFELLLDKVHGAWAGRAAGCLLGKPVEGWPREDIKLLLDNHHAYPLDGYFSSRYKLHKMKEEWMGELYESFPIEYCGGMSRDDDMDYTILALKTVETYGLDFTTGQVASMWMTYLPPFMTYTAERAAYLNLCSGIEIPRTATYRNPYREWIGAQIRADLYGYISPGDPASAAAMAYRDAALSHTRNGIYGAMFIAAMHAAAFVENDVRAILRAGLDHIPRRSRLHEAIEWVMEESLREPDWEQAGNRLLERYGHYHRVHTINNAAIVALALLYGKGELGRTITIAVMMGLDTDCNGASAGSIIGLLCGARSLPRYWTEPLQGRIESYIAGESSPRISELAMRTVRLTG